MRRVLLRFRRAYTVNTHTILCATNCISYGLLRAAHSRNLTSMSTLVPLMRPFVLILVAFEIAKASYARFACDESFCVFEELIQ